MNWWILEASLGINNDLCNNKRYIRGFGFPFSYSTITSSIILVIEIQHHEISSSTPPLALSVSCIYRTLRELLSPPFGRVASLQLSLVLCRVASLLSYSSPLPHGGPLPRGFSLVNGSVAVSGNRRSSGPGGPAAWYCTFSWHDRSVQSARRKVVTSFRSSLPRTSWVVSLVSRISFPSLGYSYLHSPWRQPRAPSPQAHPPLVAPPSVASSYCTISVAQVGLGLDLMSVGLFGFCPWLFKAAYRPLSSLYLVFIIGFQIFLLCLFGTRLRFSFCFLPICLIYFFTCASVSL